MLREKPLVELRRYLLHPGGAPQLGALFDRYFTAEHHRLGMGLLGPYVNADHPEEMVWFRYFAGLEARHVGLSAFYDGPVWREHRDAANETMVDSSNAVLLEPVLHTPEAQTLEALSPVPAPSLPALVVREAEVADASSFDADVEAVGLRPHRLWRTSEAPNTFPRLPLRHDPLRVALVGTATHDAQSREATRRRLNSGAGGFELVGLEEIPKPVEGAR